MYRVFLLVSLLTVVAACNTEPPLPPAPLPAPVAELDADREVLIATEPPGANVILKGAEVGTTPMKMLVRGNTNVVLDKEGYVKQALMITPESEPNLVVKLVPTGEGEAEPVAEAEPVETPATAKKHSGKAKKSKGAEEKGEVEEEQEAEAKPAETVAQPPPAPAPTPKKKTYSNMRQLKQDYAAGKVTKAEYRYWQNVLKQKRAQELQQLKADYDADEITKQQYKQQAAQIKKKYEG